MTTPGGPLLSVADMLQDLLEDSSSEETVALNGSSPSPSRVRISSGAQGSKSGLERQGLSESFWETSSQLNVALKESGRSWTGLTQELCSTLATADKLVATAHSNLGQLAAKVSRLEEVVNRGQEAILNLQAAIGQNMNIPLP